MAPACRLVSGRTWVGRHPQALLLGFAGGDHLADHCRIGIVGVELGQDRPHRRRAHHIIGRVLGQGLAALVDRGGELLRIALVAGKVGRVVEPVAGLLPDCRELVGGGPLHGIAGLAHVARQSGSRSLRRIRTGSVYKITASSPRATYRRRPSSRS